MSQFTSEDQHFMQLAMELAAKGQFTTTPNPAVGCVLVKNGNIVGKGFHFKAGEPHAEVMAMREAGEKAKGATAYVTLEPCSHFGRTPPCAKGLIEAGIAKVIVAMQDPNPSVAGKGLKMLMNAGIETSVGLLQEQAEALNKGFLKRMRTGMPYIQLKMAMSIDGRTATAEGESKWITGEQARADVQLQRAKASAILSASNTVLKDNPNLNVRWEQFPSELQLQYKKEQLRQPIRVIIDSKHRVLPSLNLFKINSPIWLVGTSTRDISMYPEYCHSLELQPEPNQTMLQALMMALGKQQINSIWVEAGAELAGSLIAENLVDELIIYMAPKLLGDQARGLCHLPALTKLVDAPLWKLQSIEKLGDDVKMIYTKD
nr:bifunctional diaminohydroxyphosphoribosylaminopyrimidine deaminase/5-amino-6-(5-phosphoribosylamino)uracil reductase RibD [Mannheimia massilioguelmaensis]